MEALNKIKTMATEDLEFCNELRDNRHTIEWSAKTILRLCKALERSMEISYNAYACSWDRDLASLVADDNKEIQEILEGKGE